MTKSQTTMWNKLHLIICLCVCVRDVFKNFLIQTVLVGYCNWFLVVIIPVYTRQQGAAGNSNESVCLLPLAGAQHRRKVISKWMRGLKNWKLGDKLLFPRGAKQQHNFSTDFCLCVFHHFTYPDSQLRPPVYADCFLLVSFSLLQNSIFIAVLSCMSSLILSLSHSKPLTIVI